LLALFHLFDLLLQTSGTANLGLRFADQNNRCKKQRDEHKCKEQGTRAHTRPNCIGLGFNHCHRPVAHKSAYSSESKNGRMFRFCRLTRAISVLRLAWTARILTCCSALTACNCVLYSAASCCLNSAICARYSFSIFSRSRTMAF